MRNAHLLRRIAVDATCDPRTVERYLANDPGRPVRSTVHERITCALEDRGLTQYVRRSGLALDVGPKSHA